MALVVFLYLHWMVMVTLMLLRMRMRRKTKQQAVLRLLRLVHPRVRKVVLVRFLPADYYRRP